jgi:hypothetical protein
VDHFDGSGTIGRGGNEGEMTSEGRKAVSQQKDVTFPVKMKFKLNEMENIYLLLFYFILFFYLIDFQNSGMGSRWKVWMYINSSFIFFFLVRLSVLLRIEIFSPAFVRTSLPF